MIVNKKSLVRKNQDKSCDKVLLKMLTFLQSPLISVKCWVVICDQHLHLVSPAQCDCQVYNFRNLRLISQVRHSAGANLYTCANCQVHCALADSHQMSPVSGTYIQVQIVRYIVPWQMSQLMICLSKMKLVTGILAASITTLEIKLVCFIHINNVNVLHLSKISKCHRRGN